MSEDKNKQKNETELQDEQLDEANGGAIDIRKFPKKR